MIAFGTYKFNYLSGLPGYDVDGNPLPKAEISITDEVIYFKGSTEEWNYQALLSVVAKYPDTKFKKMIINSGGGDTVYGRKIAQFVLDNQLDIEVEEMCFSSCANYILPAGKIKTIQKDAFIGWHGSEHQFYLLRKKDQTFEAYLTEGLTEALLKSGASKKEIATTIKYHIEFQRNNLKGEDVFFKNINTNVVLTLLGISKLKENGKYIGWTYSIDDMAKFGLKNVVYLGEKDKYPLVTTVKKGEHEMVSIFIEKYDQQKVQKIKQLILDNQE